MKSTKSILVILTIAAFLFIVIGWNSASANFTNSQTQSGILYVKPGANGACSSWADPCELQTALSKANTGDQIWVAAGTYKPTTDTDRTATFQLESGVAIYGGFAGTETSITQRDWESNITTLSGDIGTILDNSDNSYHVVYSYEVDSTAILDGFTISGGNANGDYEDSNDVGGGMYNFSSSSPTLNNIIFSENIATSDGGGLYNYYESNPSLNNVTFTGNTAIGDDGNGGGMYNWYGNPTLTNVTFSSNSAVTGGGISNYLCSGPGLTLIDVTFSGNTASNGGAGMVNSWSNPSLTNVTFSDNSSVNRGGGMLNYESSPSLANVAFIDNHAANGAGVSNLESNPILTNVTFSGNSATYSGGGMYNESSSPSLSNVTFSSNTAEEYGGGMSNYSSSPNLSNATFNGNHADYGGGMYNNSSSPSLTNVTLSGNAASFYGGGMRNDNCSPKLTNSILWGNTPEQVHGDTMSATYSDIQGGYTGTGNIDQDPLLGPLADNGGFTQTHALGAESPAIDAGDPNVCSSADQRGFFRPIDGDEDGNPICDMGAYEYGSTGPGQSLFLPLIVK